MTLPSHTAPRLIIGAQYFFYFGVMGVYLPFFNLYCYHIGFNAFQIGAISAVRSVVLVLFSIIWSGIADRAQSRRPIYIVFNFLSAGLWVFFLFYTEFWPMMAITILYGIFYSPLIAFLEAFTMDVLEDAKSDYGKVRAWGSIAFIATVLVLGKLITLYTIDIIIILILAGSALQAVGSVKIPKIKTIKKAVTPSQVKSLLNRPVIVFLFCGFLMLVSHGAYYGFFSIHLERLGYDSTFIGVAWALASLAEILVMLKSERLLRRVALETILTFSCLVAGLRWIALAHIESSLAILVSQLAHAVTYGTFHMASILYIDTMAPQDAKTTGQAVNNAVTYGLGLMAGFFLSGFLFDRVGASYLFYVSGMIALTAGMILGMMLRKKRKKKPKD
jgi:PPP family 3-phenylpropionic acid transporter